MDIKYNLSISLSHIVKIHHFITVIWTFICFKGDINLIIISLSPHDNVDIDSGPDICGVTYDP